MLNNKLNQMLEDTDTRGVDAEIQRTYGKHATVDDFMQATQKFFDGKNIETAKGGAVKVFNVDAVPFIGTNMLVILSESMGMLKTSTRHAQVVRFMNVKYSEEKQPGYLIGRDAKTNEPFFYKPILSKVNPTDVWCSCGDFLWRFSHVIDRRFDALAAKLQNEIKNYKRKTPPPEQGGRPWANEKQLPGLCKHLITVFGMLHQNKILI